MAAAPKHADPGGGTCDRFQPENQMTKEEELVIKVTKEIVVKFIEIGRLSPTSFDDVWNQVHRAVAASVIPGKEAQGPK